MVLAELEKRGTMHQSIFRPSLSIKSQKWHQKEKGPILINRIYVFQLDFWIVPLSNLAEMKALLFQVHIAVQMSLSYKEKETLG